MRIRDQKGDRGEEASAAQGTMQGGIMLPRFFVD